MNGKVRAKQREAGVFLGTGGLKTSEQVGGARKWLGGAEVEEIDIFLGGRFLS